ncbi:P-loop NTPase fold protein [Shewanella algae]|uniref:P-loop NTPase fold protein n=1 Tax=Shewanella algae TaxID=38313 RepID=UPI0031F4DEB8
MKINKHIEDNLLHYLGLNNPEYAFLISGDWGVGKTFFIDNFIKENSKSQKIVKISLFGLSSSSQIDQRIFQELHPVLGSKPARFIGNVLKGAISLGFKVDIDLDGSPDSNINTKFDKFDLTEYFSEDKGKQKEIVLVFDDLERTDIPLGEVLGFINYLVEVSSIKVILVANEQVLLEEDNAEFYKKFKEKVIGKTFEVKHDIDDFLSELLNDKNFEDDEIYIIKEVYENSKYKNLRKIKQSLNDFEFAKSQIEDNFLDCNEFRKEFLKIYLALSLEIKRGNLDKEDLLKNTPFKSEKESKNYDIYKKYFRNSTNLFHGKTWCEILFSSDFSTVNNEVSKLAYFIEKQNTERPDWVKLWHFRELEDDEFFDLLFNLGNELRTLEENNLRVYLHKIALITYFSKNNLAKITLEEIQEYVTNYIEKHKASSQWRDELVSIESDFNGTGYGYYNSDDSDFINLKKLILDANKSSYEENKVEKKKNDLGALIECIKNGDNDYVIDTLLKEYEYTSIFHEINPSEFVHALVNAENKNINYLSRVLNERYSKNHYLNNRVKYSFFTNELNFWRELKNQIDMESSTKSPLKNHILSNISEYTVSEIISLLSDALEQDGITRGSR